jgi:hypothetical protein
MALELADDRGDRERTELDAAVEVEAVDRPEQAEVGDLDQVLKRLVGAVIAPGEPARHRRELLEQPLARLAARIGGRTTVDGHRHHASLSSPGCVSAYVAGVGQPAGAERNLRPSPPAVGLDLLGANGHLLETNPAL